MFFLWQDIPNVRLKAEGKDADLECLSQRVPILPGDVQRFLLFSQLGSDSPCFPRYTFSSLFSSINVFISSYLSLFLNSQFENV